MEITISFDEEKLKSFLPSITGSCGCISWGNARKEIEELLNRPNVTVYGRDYFDEEQKNHFVESYVDLMGKLARKNNTVIWWATNTAAKNQFRSSLFENLYLYMVILDIVRKNKYERLLVISPPVELYSALIKYFRQNRIKYTVLGSAYSFNKAIRKKLAPWANRRDFIKITIRRIYIAKRLLKKRLDSQLEAGANYYVLRTWFYPGTLGNEGYVDSFFGILPGYLVSQGKKLLILAGILGEYRPVVEKIAKQNESLIFPPELFLRYADPFRAVMAMLFRRISVERNIELDGVNVSEIVKKERQREFSSAAPLYNFLNFYCLKRLLSQVKISNFITIYENNAWERMCILALRKYSPRTHIIGYQHPPLFEAAINMVLSKYEKDIIPMPHKINTIGKVNKTWLEKHGNYDSNRLRESCALRMDIVNSSELAPRKSSGRLLLILGGIDKRAISLLNFVAKGMNTTGGYKIVVRPHPELPFRVIAEKLDFDFPASAFFSLSDNPSVSRDLEEADIVLYDASTIALQALFMGIPVVHIALKDILSFDPLADCKYLKWTVSTEKDLHGTIRKIYSLSGADFSQRQQEGRKYIQDYVYPVTGERLSEFMI